MSLKRILRRFFKRFFSPLDPTPGRPPDFWANLARSHCDRLCVVRPGRALFNPDRRELGMARGYGHWRAGRPWCERNPMTLCTREPSSTQHRLSAPRVGFVKYITVLYCNSWNLQWKRPIPRCKKAPSYCAFWMKVWQPSTLVSILSMNVLSYTRRKMQNFPAFRDSRQS